VLRVDRLNKPYSQIMQQLKERESLPVSGYMHDQYVNLLGLSVHLTPTLHFYQTIGGEYIPLTDKASEYISFCSKVLSDENVDVFLHRKVQSLLINVVEFSSGIPMVDCTEETYEKQIKEAREIAEILS
jgi:hypothetical protein